MSATDPEFGCRPFEVRLNRAVFHPQFFGDLRHRTAGQQAQADFLFACRKDDATHRQALIEHQRQRCLIEFGLGQAWLAGQGLPTDVRMAFDQGQQGVRKAFEKRQLRQ